MTTPMNTAAAVLERSADRVLVLAPPVEAMLAEAGRRRRTRRGAIVGTVLAVLATLGVADTVASVVDTEPRAWPASGPPDGMRFVGIGRAVIAVPRGWDTDATRCGQPVRDTVVLDPPAPTCRAPRPADVSSVVIREGEPAGFEAATTYEIEDRTVERSAVRCAAGTCTAVAVLPSEDVSFTVSSSAGRPELARAEVAALSDNLRVLDGVTTVPSIRTLAEDYGRSAQTKYVADLRALGLQPVVESGLPSGAPAGTVTGVSPPPGTPLEADSVVRVSVAPGARGPQDRVAVGIGSVDEDHNYRGLTHEDVRRGATLRVPEGTDIWAHADGERSLTLDARQQGASIAIDFWRNGPNWPTAWEAVMPGTTLLTLSIRAEGRRFDIGTVRIVVTGGSGRADGSGRTGRTGGADWSDWADWAGWLKTSQNRIRKANRKTPSTGDQSASGTRPNPSRP